jgi:hypothetical protein
LQTGAWKKRKFLTEKRSQSEQDGVGLGARGKAMTSRTPWLRAGLAVLLVALGSASAQAAGMGFKSNVPIPVIVQGATNVGNMLRRGAPVVIPPGKVGWDLNLKPGVRIVTIYDGRMPTRVLYQGPFLFQGRDVIFSINRHPRNPFQVIVTFP